MRELYDRLEDEFPTYLESWIEARSAIALHEDAKRWHNNPGSASLSAGVERNERLRRRYERELSDQREQRQARPQTPVERNVPALLAALTFLTENGVE